MSSARNGADRGAEQNGRLGPAELEQLLRVLELGRAEHLRAELAKVLPRAGALH